MNTTRSVLFFAGICMAILLFVPACKKPVLLSKGNLAFSVDTLVFDTVFTTVGSTTQSFKIYNRENRSVMVEEIELIGGQNSPFRINIDGVSGDKHADIEVLANDSLFAFVEVTLQVNNQTLPMIVEDSIRFRTNGTDQYVRLAVWGQDAYFHYADTTEGTWPNDKPHVVYGYSLVAPGSTLTIQKETKVHFHKNSLLFVGGSLQVNGEKDKEVVFQGDRLEPFYQDVAGQWFGIYFGEASTSSINYAIIMNGTSGIQMYGENATNPGYTLTVTNTRIQNNASYGILLYNGPKLKAENCVITNSGAHSFFVLGGAHYHLNHCTIAGYGSSGQTPAFAVRNYFTQDGVSYVSGIGEGTVVNSIIYGNLETELAMDTINPNGTANFFQVEFRNCLIKYKNPPTNAKFIAPRWNNEPFFKEIGAFDFSISNPASGASNHAAPGIYFLPTDIVGSPRGNPADLGAFEIQ